MVQVSKITKRRKSIMRTTIKTRNFKNSHKEAFFQTSRTWRFSLNNPKNHKVIRKPRKQETNQSKIKNTSKNDKSRIIQEIYEMFNETFNVDDIDDLDDLDVEMSEMNDDVDNDIDEEIVDEEIVDEEMVDAEDNNCDKCTTDVHVDFNKTSVANQVTENDTSSIAQSLDPLGPCGGVSDTKDKGVKYDFICDCCKSKFKIQILLSI
ncbi:uncharacterized protein OCT59_002986 [Rhizophagus irregularis]|uniref:Uncharacterized protein n=2 Tax=Rhizophagus irregularis TaxID=588596 RepID=A0A916EFA9_9GLOM|nr:hypothetical protein GLOIN_2v1782079 [Rhizophagus irregularis DAOM 181602=DAOM 197198]POG65123.1 hypothetical protein GLOIN_2v1782079 [Rhizophagus irregularis DAOM 181602=DAOM 197198]UZO11417.1 hypothetical protein OCT59_002986 [Rhizophagus irregularis]CAB4481393.1 unnamed protein product [Rhizophagus irregularis]CAB5383250.1 unnamed protein product [Rhizophagus irregularis]|eukprot:XP_025171989.1 hypothetical protein GLOIN_2v1782079 [Rhizophagus irregularis DAOM 181602=DAOM 197198]